MKKVLFFLLAVMLSLPLTMRAQEIVEIGTGTSTSSHPFYGLYANSWCEMIYPASAFETTGSITQLAWNCSTVNQQVYSTLKIYLGTKSANTYSSAADWTPMSDLTLVYDHTNVTVGATTGWQTFDLDDTFLYDGSENLVVVVVKTMPSYSSTNYYYTANSNTCLYRGSDSDVSFGTTHPGSATGTCSSYSSNIRISVLNVGGCISPKQIEASNITDNSADISWRYNEDASSYDIYETTSATDIPDSNTVATSTVNDTIYSMSELSPSTTYYVWVRTDCGDGVSKWRMVSFLTPQIPVELPYSQDFEDEDENANWTLTENGVNKWVIGSAVNTTTDGENALYVSNDYGVTNNYSTSSTSTSWAYRDIDFGTTYAEYEISFKYRGVGESTGYDYVKVFLGSPATPPTSWAYSSTFPGVTFLGTLVLQPNWIDATAVVNSTFQGVQRLYFLWWNDGSAGNPPAGAIDDLTITGKTCGTPRNLAAGAITTTTIPVTFTPALETDDAWEILIVNQGDTIDESLAVSITDPYYTFEDLTEDTPYDIYVRTDCGSETSFWSQALSVRTACPDYMSIPYAESFDTYGTGTSATSYPSCWSRLTNYTYTNYPYITSSSPSSAPGNLYFYSYASSSYYSTAIAPEVDTNTNPINTLSVSFKIKKTATTAGSGAMEVGIMTDPTDNSTFTAVQTFTGNEFAAANTWYEVEVPLTDYTGSGSYIALRKPATTNGYTYIDDFSVYATPTCLKPMDVAVSQITDNSVTVSWTARSGESAWSVVVVPAGDDPETGVAEQVYTNPCTISELTDNTAYDVYVKADCGGGDESPWATAVSFRTRCLPTDIIPYVENFDDYGTTSFTSFPNCWGRKTNYSNSYPYVSSSYKYSGAGALYFYSTATYYSLATSQALDLSAFTANSLMLSFKALKTSEAYGRLDVGIMTDPDNLNTMTVLKSIYPNEYSGTSTWQDFNIILPSAYETGNVYLAFLAPASGTSYVYVDTVSLDYAPTCMSPTDLVISTVSGTSAAMSWTAPEVEISSYTVEYSEADQESWVTASSSVTETNYILSGLQSQTAYDVRVSSNCDEGTSDPIAVSFSTLAYLECLQPDTSANEITSATPSTSYYVPVNNFFNYSYTQQIYTADEIDSSHTPTVITGLAFQYNYGSSMSGKSNVDIYLAHRSTNSFSSTSDWTPISSATLVYQGPLNCSQGWNAIDFDNDFSYNGTDNLVVIVDDNSGDYDGSAYVFNVHTPATSNMSLYCQNDNSNPNPLTPPTGTRASIRSDIKIYTCEQSAPITCVAPIILSSSADDESITVSWMAGLNETSWEMEYKTGSEGTWTSQGSVTASPYTLTGLTANTVYNIRLRSECGSGEYSDWVTTNVQTECGSISLLPYTEGFESASGSGTGHFISCWQKGTNSSTAYPYTSTTYKHGGNYSLYLYGTSSSYCYAATPRFDDEIDMSNLQISFYGYKTTASYSIEVGIMTDPTDYSTFQLVGSFSPEENSTWELAEINTDAYTGTGHYVAFRQPQFTTNGMYIDDIDIHEIPLCGRVENITVSQIATTTATVSWTPGGDETAWEVVYGLAGTVDLTTAIPTPVSTPSIDLTGLTPSSAYDVYVRIDCGGGEYGAWTQEDFRTACGMINVPFSEDFESFATGSASDMPCWNKFSSYSSGYPYISNSYAQSGSKSVYFYSGSSQYNLLATPQFESSVDMTTLQVVFSMRASNIAGTKMIVGVMTNPSDASTFEGIDTLAVSTTNTWEIFEVALTSYTGTGKYIAFKSLNTGYYSIFMDDVNIDVIPSCPRPTQVTATSSATDSISLSWTDATGDLWDVIYGPAGFDPATSEIATLIPGVSENPYIVTGLAAGMSYDFYVRSDCGGGEVSPWSYSHGSASPYTITMGITGSDTITACGVTITDDGGIGGNYSDNCEYYLVIYPSDPDSLLVVSGTFAGESTYDYLEIYEGVGTGNLIDKVSASLYNQNNGVTFPFGPFTSESGPLTLRFHSDVSTNYEGFAANVSCIAAPSCRRPINFVSTGSTSTTVSLAWTEQGDATAWNVAYGPAGFTPSDTSIIVPVTDVTATITDLTASTTYDFYVQSDCGGEVSEWTGPVTVTPGTFNMPVTGNQTITMCGGIIYDDGGPTGNYSSYCNSTLTVMPDQGMLIQVQGTYDMESCCDHLIIYDGTSASGTPLWQHTSSLGQSGTIPLLESTSGPITLSFSSDVSLQYSGFALTVSCVDAPTCRKPVALTASAATTSSVDLFWTEMGTATSWNIEYGPAGFTQGQGTLVSATTNPYTLTGLTASTSYDVYVQSDCGGGDVSDWTAAISFATSCDAIDVPYLETFDSYTSGVATSTVSPTGYPDVTMPACWTFLNRSTSSSTYPMAFLSSYSSYVVAGNCLFFKSSSSTPLYAVLPEFTDNISNLKLSFYYRNEGTGTSNGTLYVGYMTDIDDATSFTSVQTCTQTTTITNIADVTFAGAPAGAYIAFKYEGGTYDNFYLSIDSVYVTLNGSAPTCDIPNNVAASNVTYNTASINWTAGGNETAWNLQYKKANQTTWSNSIAVTSRPYTLSGLDAQTAYNVRVQANCGADGTSEWSTVANFTTAATPAEPCDAPTGLTVSNITTTTAVVTWTPGGDENAWNVQYKLTSASEWNNAPVSAPTYTIEGLTPESNYTVQVQAKCSETNLSGWVSTTFTTQGTGISNVELANSISIMPNPAESYIELTINSNVSVKEASIYNAFGQLIQKVALNDNHARIDVSEMAAGMYFVRIANDNTMATKKFIKK